MLSRSAWRAARVLRGSKVTASPSNTNSSSTTTINTTYELDRCTCKSLRLIRSKSTSTRDADLALSPPNSVSHALFQPFSANQVLDLASIVVEINRCQRKRPRSTYRQPRIRLESKYLVMTLHYVAPADHLILFVLFASSSLIEMLLLLLQLQLLRMVHKQ